MHQIKHLLRLVCDHEMGAVFNFKELAAPRGVLLVLSDHIIGAFRAEKIIITKRVGDRKVYSWIAKPVNSCHRVSCKEGVLKWHYFDYLQDARSSEHLDLVVDNYLTLFLA